MGAILIAAFIAFVVALALMKEGQQQIVVALFWMLLAVAVFVPIIL